MFGGGENKIPEGGKKAVETSACDPSAHSCVDWVTAEEASCLSSGVDNSAGAPECVPGLDEFAVSDMSVPPESPVMTQAQAAFYKDAPEAEALGDEIIPPYGYEIKSDEILDEIFVQLESPEITYSALEALVEGPPVGLVGYTPAITADSKSESYDVFGAGVDGHEYTVMYQDGANGLRDLGKYLMQPPDKMVSADIGKAWSGFEMYAAGEHAVYGEGISHGWTVSHSLEFYTNCVYEAGRSSMSGSDAAFVELSGFNFGLNMTDLNKRDTSGKLGDILRDEMRRLANREFGDKVWDGGYPGNGIRSADNIAATKNMTVLVMGGPCEDQGSDLTEQKAQDGLKNVQEGLQKYIETEDFRRELERVHGEKASKIDLKGVKIGLAGYYGEAAIDPLDASKGKLETKIVEFLGELHHGEDVASKMHRVSAAHKPSYVHTKSVKGSKGAEAATHKLYGLYKSPSPGLAKKWGPGKPIEGKLEIPLEDLEKGEVLRPAHDFGMGLRHVEEIKTRLAALESAISEYKVVKKNNPLKIDAAFEKVCKAQSELLEYIKNPPAEIDPARVGVVERYANDFARSKKVYRIRTADGKDLFVYKPDHIQETIVGKKGWGKSSQWLMGTELGKFGDYMAKYASHDGVMDPAFAQIFDELREGFRERGFELVQGIQGGDEFLLHVKEGEGKIKTDADVEKAMTEVIAEFEEKHKDRPFVYSEKANLPGGKWNGVQFGVKGKKILFKQPEGTSDAEFKSKVEATLAEEGFRTAVKENFNTVETFNEVEIVTEEAFAKEGASSRRQVWHVEGGKNELYLNWSCATKDAYRPERTLTMEASVASMDSKRDYPILVNEVLPAGIQENKKTGKKVAMMPKLTLAQKKRSRIEWRLGASAAGFGFASVGSQVIWNVLSGDHWLKNVDAMETAEIWGTMTVAAGGTELLYRAGSAALAKELFTRTAAGKLRFNPKAMRRPVVGAKAKFMGGLAGAVALVAVDMVINYDELIEHGRPDPVRLANQGALILSAAYLTRAATVAGPLRKASNFHPGKMLAEFLVMMTLGAAEMEAVESYMRMEKRERVAAAMSSVDGSIAEMEEAKKAGSKGDFLDASKRHAEAKNELAEAFNDLMALEKYTDTEEFEIIEDINDDIEGMKDDLLRIENMEGHPDDMSDMQKINYMSPVSGSAGVHEMKFSKSMVKDIRRQRRAKYAALKEAAWGSSETAEKAFLKNTSDLKGDVSAKDIRIPFEFEKEPFVEEKAYEYQSAGPVPMEAEEIDYGPDDYSMSGTDEAERDWSDRYYDLMSDDTHTLQLQYMLFVKEREDYLSTLLTSSSDASEED